MLDPLTQRTHFQITVLGLYGQANKMSQRLKPEDHVAFSLARYRAEVRNAIGSLGLQGMQRLE